MNLNFPKELKKDLLVNLARDSVNTPTLIIDNYVENNYTLGHKFWLVSNLVPLDELKEIDKLYQLDEIIVTAYLLDYEETVKAQLEEALNSTLNQL